MKNNIIVLLSAVIFYPLFAQDKHFVVLMDDNIEIPIYENAIGNKLKYRIMQDTINEMFFAVEILENSPLRYKVNITSVINSFTGPEIVGWIDKNKCGVYKRWYYDEDKRRYMKLYTLPDKNSSYDVVYEDSDIYDSIVTVIDYADPNWKKILFYQGDILYEGWVDRYCASVYNSCN